MKNAKCKTKIARSTLHACVDEMYLMEKGILIERPEKIISQNGDGYITRKQIKHIIEQRKAEGKSMIEIKEIVDHIPNVIRNPDFELPNQNPRYLKSVIRYKFFPKWERGIVVVMDNAMNGQRKVITAHLCSPKKISLLKKKLDASAAGETPRS